MTVRICGVCGQTFEAAKNQLSCAGLCAQTRKNVKQRERYAANPDYREHNKAKALERYHLCRTADPHYRKHKNAMARERQRLRRGTKTNEHPCAVCGQIFLSRWRRTVCSDSCRLLYKKEYLSWYHENRMATDPGYRENRKRNNKTTTARERQRRATDPEYRVRYRERQRELRLRLKADPDYQAHRNEKARERALRQKVADPDAWKRKCDKDNERHRRRKATDPDYLAYCREKSRERDRQHRMDPAFLKQEAERSWRYWIEGRAVQKHFQARGETITLSEAHRLFKRLEALDDLKAEHDQHGSTG